MIVDFFRFALENIRHSQIRSWLTMIGVFIGVALFVSLLSLGQGLQNAINEQFEALGTDKIFIQPATVAGSPTAVIEPFDDKDKRLVGSVKGVENYAAWSYGIGRIEFDDVVIYNYVMGIPLNQERKLFEEFGDFEIEEGRELKSGDKYKVALGWDLVNVPNIFGTDVIMIGDKILIDEHEFEVVGSYSRVGNPQDDRQFYIPLDTYDDIYCKKNEYNFIIAQTKNNVVPSDVAENIKDKIRKDRDEDVGDESFSVDTSEEFRESFNDIFNIVNYFVAGLAFISLLVGSVGITNTMYTSVLERTKEIGIMKAIGARNQDILLVFLVEAGVIGLIGGIIGTILGFGASKLVEYIVVNVIGFELLSVQLNIPLVIGVIIGSAIFGGLAGLLPARQAAKQQPVEALRYE